jgi:hypothetical protein
MATITAPAPAGWTIGSDLFTLSLDKTSTGYLTGTWVIDTGATAGGADTLLFTATIKPVNGSYQDGNWPNPMLQLSELGGLNIYELDKRASPFSVVWANWDPTSGDQIKFQGTMVDTAGNVLAQQTSQAMNVSMVKNFSGQNILAVAMTRDGEVPVSGEGTDVVDLTFNATGVLQKLSTSGASYSTSIQPTSGSFSGWLNLSSQSLSNALPTYASNGTSSPSTSEIGNIVQLAVTNALRNYATTYQNSLGTSGSNATSNSNYHDNISITLDDRALYKVIGDASRLFSYLPGQGFKGEDVAYDLNIDPSGLSGVSFYEANSTSGMGNSWWDSVRYTELGIKADGTLGWLPTMNNPNWAAAQKFIGGSGAVNVSQDTITLQGHSFNTGDRVVYDPGTGGTAIGGLTAGTGTANAQTGTNVYTVFRVDENTIKLQNSTGALIDLTSAGIGNAQSFAVAPSTWDNPLTVSVGRFDWQGNALTNSWESGFNTRVDRGNGVIDVYSGFENFTLTDRADTVNITVGTMATTNENSGQGNRVFKLLGGNDTVNISVSGTGSDWSTKQLELDYSDNGASTNGIFVNLSGINRTLSNGVLLNSSAGASFNGITETFLDNARGQIYDSTGGVDTINVMRALGSTGAPGTMSAVNADNLNLRLDGTSFNDRFYLAGDGLGSFGRYDLDGSGGYDLYSLQSNPVLNGRALTGVMSTGGSWDSLSGNEYLASFSINYANFQEDLPAQISFGFYSGVVDKKQYGFDRFLDDPTLEMVGGRHFMLTGQGDYAEQVRQVNSNEFSLDMGGGADRVFWALRNDDGAVSQRLFLGDGNNWGSSSGAGANGDGNADRVEISLDRLATRTLSVNVGAGTSQSQVVNIANDTITLANHGLASGDRVSFSAIDSTMVGGLSQNTDYFAIAVDSNTIKLASTFQNAIGAISGTVNGLNTYAAPVAVDITSLSSTGGSFKLQRAAETMWIDNAESIDSIKFIDTNNQYDITASNSAGQSLTYSIASKANPTDIVANVIVQGVSGVNLSSSNLASSVPNWGGVSNTQTVYNSLPTVSMTADVDNALLFEDSGIGPYDFKGGNDNVVINGGDIDVALGAGDDFVSIRRAANTVIVSGGAGTDQVGLSDRAQDWTFSTANVATINQLLQAKYPLTPNIDPNTGPFQWDNSALDLVMVATSKIDGTTIFYQAEKTSFTDGTFIDTSSLMPAQNLSYDATIATATAVNIYGRRGSTDTVTLKVANVDEALRNIGTWMDSTTTAQATTLGPIAGSYTLNLKAQTAATGAWFTGSSSVLNAGYNLVDIENLKLVDAAGRSTTVRIAGINGYDSVSDAVSAAQRGDVIYVSDFKEVLTSQTATTATSTQMDSNITVDAGLRVIFEESRTTALSSGVVNTVNISENAAKLADASLSSFFGGARALEVLGSSAVNVNGSTQDDLVIGNKGANTILGGAGNDLVFGGNGADIVLGQQGNDILIGGSAYSVKGASVLASASTVSSAMETINLGAGHLFNTGDAVQYVVGTGGAAITGLTTATTYYAIKVDDATIKLATSASNAMSNVAIDITAPTTAQTVKHFFVPNTAVQGSDFLSGGSGNDTLIAVNAIGTSTTAFDTVSMLGGSGNDKMVAFGNTGKVNAFGGTGNDLYQTWDDFNSIKVAGGTDGPSYTNSQKAMKVFDFAALNDDIVSTFTSSTPEAQLNANGLTLNQLVAPPLPIVNGTGDNGNYSQAANQTLQGMDLGWSGASTISIADLVNQHSAHAV